MEHQHGAEKVLFFSSNFTPCIGNISKLELKEGILLAHVGKPLSGLAIKEMVSMLVIEGWFLSSKIVKLMK